MGVGNISNRSGGANFIFAHGNYEPLAIPNASGALVSGVNPSGSALVGYYMPSSGVTAGFLYQNKTLTTLQFPGSIYTLAAGINAGGQVCGFFYDANAALHGFTWTPSADAAKP